MQRLALRAALAAAPLVLLAMICLRTNGIVTAAPAAPAAAFPGGPANGLSPDGGDAGSVRLHGIAGTGEFVVGFASTVTGSGARAAAATGNAAAGATRA